MGGRRAGPDAHHQRVDHRLLPVVRAELPVIRVDRMRYAASSTDSQGRAVSQFRQQFVGVQQFVGAEQALGISRSAGLAAVAASESEGGAIVPEHQQRPTWNDCFHRVIQDRAPFTRRKMKIADSNKIV